MSQTSFDWFGSQLLPVNTQNSESLVGAFHTLCGKSYSLYLITSYTEADVLPHYMWYAEHNLTLSILNDMKVKKVREKKEKLKATTFWY